MKILHPVYRRFFNHLKSRNKKPSGNHISSLPFCKPLSIYAGTRSIETFFDYSVFLQIKKSIWLGKMCIIFDVFSQKSPRNEK